MKINPFLTFKSSVPFSIEVHYPGWKNYNSTGIVEFSTDSEIAKSWKEWDGSPVSAQRSSKDRCYYLYFRGKKNTVITGGQGHGWLIKGLAGCYGNIMTLLNYENPDMAEMDEKCFERMFYGNSALTSAPELPADTLSYRCYYEMFAGCSNLTSAPELPATILAPDCYYSMFYECIRLAEVPELPATTLDNWCYCRMFSGCTRLTEAPELPATKLTKGCYKEMFYGCKGLTTVPELHAYDLEQYCYDRMFSMCSKLKINTRGIGINFLTMPKNIPYSAVSGMFYGTGENNLPDPESNGKYYCD